MNAITVAIAWWRPLAELGRCHAERGAEGPGERLVAAVPRVQRDPDNRAVAGLQLHGGPLQPQPPDVAAHGLADHSPKDAVEVIGRKSGDAGQVALDRDCGFQEGGSPGVGPCGTTFPSFGVSRGDGEPQRGSLLSLPSQSWSMPSLQISGAPG